jgi:hypothetical protein
MNSRQIGISEDVIRALMSDDGPQNSLLTVCIYLHLIVAPPELWEVNSILRFKGEMTKDKSVSAWERVFELIRAEPRVTRVALQRMEQRNIITYCEVEKEDELIIMFNGLNRAVGDIEITELK